MDGWCLDFEGYDAADEGRREALCTLGNGWFATRGAAAEARADGTHYPGTYASGFYNRLADHVEGVDIENESLVNLPSWLRVELAVDGGWFHLDGADLPAYRQRLDLRHGVLTRSLRFRDATGRVTALTERRFVHMGSPHLAGIQLTVTAENWSGELRVRSLVDGTVENTGVARYRRLSGRHLSHLEAGHADGSAYVVARTTQSRLRVAVAARTRASTDPGTDATLTHERVQPAPGTVGDEVVARLAAGTSLRVEKVAAVVTSRDPAVSEPLVEALDELAHAPDFETLLAGHDRAWSRLWSRFGVDLRDASPDLPEDLLRNLRLGVFHLLQTASPHSRERDAGLPARGLHGEAYRGHVFWDELFVLPLVASRMPGIARSLLLYRYRRLPAARRAAREIGCRGACFPWQSGSEGREESQSLHLNPLSGHWVPDVTHLQRHVGLAVALSTWRYLEATGDRDFLCDYGAELLLETALFFADLARLDERRQRFCITGVVGPDEYHTRRPGSVPSGIDNNAYTNVMAAWLAGIAGRTLDLLPAGRRRELEAELGVGAAERSRWEQMATRMFVPFHDGVLSQFEGYDDLLELDWEGLRARHGDIRRLDRVLEAEGSSVDAYKASKQADVLMLFYVFSAEEIATLLGRLGYPFQPADIPSTIDYYLSRTCHGSTLSAVVHAWVLARSRRDEAVEFLLDAVHSDVHDTQGGTTAEGVHLAAMTSGIDLVQRCFAGIEPRLDRLDISPCWPAALGRAVLELRYRGQALEVTVGTDAVRVVSSPDNEVAVPVRCGRVRRRLRPGETVDLAVPPAGRRRPRAGPRGTNDRGRPPASGGTLAGTT